ncbi:DUF805 domain-containing protein [Bifidobacterium sp. ESL0800]|uniref:DUF805 domain-containing protein n=1 Tax=Bifidobacterium sp. ESL0800 TaxID=2983236 RepID=UPI0023F905CA|nr:DUF805 domain-containing protein [Bifidobacterium sp. ESL0800]WEV75214.1 DUF805 domain-containing protein [Bifidobacterium sp. ESL0800]
MQQPAMPQPGESQNFAGNLPPLPGSGTSQTGSAPQYQYSAPQAEQGNVPPQYAGNQPTDQGGAPAFPAGAPDQPQPYGGPNPNDFAASMAVPLNMPYYGCSFVDAVKRFFLKYVKFSGRASRSEFWWAQLFLFIVAIVLNIIDQALFHKNDTFLDTIWNLAVFLPTLAVDIRRLHDTNKSGWWILFPYGLVIGGAIVFFFTAIAAGLSVGSVMDSSEALLRTVGAGAVGGVIVGAIIFLLCMLAGFIVGIVFMVQGPNPQGARFDENQPLQASVQGQYMPPMDQGAPMAQGMPMNAQYDQAATPGAFAGNPYEQNANQQAGTPAQPQYGAGQQSQSQAPYDQPHASGFGNENLNNDGNGNGNVGNGYDSNR